jgi:hypothetical protein
MLAVGITAKSNAAGQAQIFAPLSAIAVENVIELE